VVVSPYIPYEFKNN
jgi:hypothetical protein